MLVTTQTQFQSLSALQSIAPLEAQISDICIIGDGAVSLAAGCLFAGSVHSLRVLSLPGKHIPEALPTEFEIRDRGASVSTFRARTCFTNRTIDYKTALRGADAIVISSPATEYGVLAKNLAPVLANGQTIFLLNSPLAGGLEFEHRVRTLKRDLQINVVEVGALFDSAKIEGGVLLITGRRDKISFCGNSRNASRKALESTSTLSEFLVPCSNPLERGFSEVEKFIRPSLLLFAIMGARGKELDCISNIINPALTAVISAIEAELQALAKNYKCIVHNFFDTLHDFSGARWEDADCLDQALISVSKSFLEQNVNRASGSDSIPMDAAIAVLKSDVQETLVLVSELARLSRTPVPVINSVIDLAAAATRCDLQKQSRTLADLGLMGFDAQEIVEIANS